PASRKSMPLGENMQLEKRSLEELSRALRSRELSSTGLIEKAQANYDRWETALNVYKTWNGEGARKQQQADDLLLDSNCDLGPLMGLPVSVKDLFGVPGLPVFAGSDSALPQQYSAAVPVVQSVLSQLGV